MDLAKARAFNLRQSFSALQVSAIAVSIGATSKEVQLWGDVVLIQVADFQKRNGLTADGMVGPQTLAKMGAASEGGLRRRDIPNLIHEAAARFPDHRFGTDLSLWNDDIDPTKMQGVSFAILKATESDFMDPLFERHRETFKRAPNVTLGNYHLPRMVQGKKGLWGRGDMVVLDPVKQARFSIIVAKANPAALGDWFDFEPDSVGNPDKTPRFFSALLIALGGDKEKAAQWVGSWLDVFEDGMGREAGDYLSPRIAKEGGEPLRLVLGTRKRWVATYPQFPKLPFESSLPDSWGDEWDIWQCRGSDNKETAGVDEGGKCLGIGRGVKDCDQNVMNPASSLMRLLAA